MNGGGSSCGKLAFEALLVHLFAEPVAKFVVDFEYRTAYGIALFRVDQLCIFHETNYTTWHLDTATAKRQAQLTRPFALKKPFGRSKENRNCSCLVKTSVRVRRRGETRRVEACRIENVECKM